MNNHDIISEPCPCGSEKSYGKCCQPIVEGTVSAESPEKLMRSRYCAYFFGNEKHLLETWLLSTRPESIDLKNSLAIKWVDLNILSAPPSQDDEGTVDFIARYKENGKAGKLHEKSRFKRENGKWFYVNGNTE